MLAVPCKIVKGKERSVGDEDHIEGAVADDDVVGLFNYALERTTAGTGGRGVVDAVDKDVFVGADHPVDVERRMDGFLDVGAIEVGLGEADRTRRRVLAKVMVRGYRGQVQVERRREAEHIP